MTDLKLPGRWALLWLALCPSLALAQHESRWYKVELMVITHESVPDGEQFDPTPVLAYPEPHRFLLHPEQLRERAALHDGESELDPFGRLHLLPVLDEPDTPDIPLQGVNESAPVDEVPEEEAPPETAAPEEPPRPTAFVALPASQREFRGKAAYMARTGEYRILFHQAWVQPVMGEREAVPLVLDRSGDSGEWPELQGSVKLHVARYLHLETQLWLNTRGDYLPGEWRMPDAPLGPPSVVIVEPPAPDPNELGAEPSQVTVYDDTLPLEGLDEDLAETGEEIAVPASPWRHAVLLAQKRRMRSLEVHYLDHPLLSVVIRLEPLGDEQLAEMAAAETPIFPEPAP